MSAPLVMKGVPVRNSSDREREHTLIARFYLAWISNVCWLLDFFLTNTMLYPLYTNPFDWHQHTDSHLQTHLHQSTTPIIATTF